MAVLNQVPGGVVWPGCPMMVYLAPLVPREGGGGKRGAQPAGTVVGKVGDMLTVFFSLVLLSSCPLGLVSVPTSRDNQENGSENQTYLIPG